MQPALATNRGATTMAVWVSFLSEGPMSSVIANQRRKFRPRLRPSGTANPEPRLRSTTITRLSGTMTFPRESSLPIIIVIISIHRHYRDDPADFASLRSPSSLANISANIELHPQNEALGGSSKQKYIKRPLNAYMIWTRQERKRILAEDSKMKMNEVSKAVGFTFDMAPPLLVPSACDVL
jgi:hypothetical protein